MKTIISNTSPLIALARAGLFHLLKRVYQSIVQMRSI